MIWIYCGHESCTVCLYHVFVMCSGSCIVCWTFYLGMAYHVTEASDILQYCCHGILAIIDTMYISALLISARKSYCVILNSNHRDRVDGNYQLTEIQPANQDELQNDYSCI